ncbi:hypothetical protein NSZ01_31450 [Nocardioides szechwanensis]|nr:hypothetical protein NSZ01_31450 [Nocardioides szechwanensis]
MTSNRICTLLSQASSIVITQSQLDVCGAPTRIPLRGTVPVVFQRAARRTTRANVLRIRKRRPMARTYRVASV